MLGDLLRSLAGLRLTDEEGKEHVLQLLPPATAAEIRKLEDTARVGVPMSPRVVGIGGIFFKARDPDRLWEPAKP